MSLKLHKGIFKVKDNGQLKDIDIVVGDTAQRIKEINDAGTAKINAIQTKGTQVLNSIPDDYETLSNDVANIKDDLSEINNTTTTKETAGKVWTTTATGAEWKTPTGGSGDVTKEDIKYAIYYEDGDEEPDVDEFVLESDFNTALSNKANIGASYTKSESDAKYLTEHQSLTGLATETYVDNKVSNLVNSAPETLDTLKELSDALGGDENFATTIAGQIGQKANSSDVYTKSESDNKYLTEHQDVSGKMDKSALLDAGIKSITWSTVRSEITVTTVEDPYKSQRPEGTDTRYWVEFEDCPYFKNRQLYRVTFNGTVYDNLVCDYGILVNDGSAGKHASSTNSEVGGAWQLIGNKHLFDSRYEDTNEPFCFIYIEHGGMNTDGSYYYGYQVGHGCLFTESASDNTFKIERAIIEQDELPKSLFNNYGYGDITYQNIGESTYPRTSLGQGNIVGRGSFAIGNGNISTEQYSIAVGKANVSKGYSSFACGSETVASGKFSHAEGGKTIASYDFTHAEGYNTYSSGQASHSEGFGTQAIKSASHAEGSNTIANAKCSHVEGYNTKSSGNFQHVQGKCNIEDSSSQYAHIVGNGTSDTARSNAHTLDWDGNAWFSGNVYVGSTSGTNKDDGSKKLVTEDELSAKQNALTDADKQSIVKTGITSGEDWTAEEQSNARARLGIVSAEGVYF